MDCTARPTAPDIGSLCTLQQIHEYFTWFHPASWEVQLHDRTSPLDQRVFVRDSIATGRTASSIPLQSLALVTMGRVDLPVALSAAQEIYGSAFNPQITLKALSYFDDGDLHQVPDDVRLRLVTAVRNVDLDHLPSLDAAILRVNKDHGLEL